MLPMEKERQVKKSLCWMVCLIVAQFVYLIVGSAFFMTLERESAQRSYESALEDLIDLRKELNLTPHQAEVLQLVFSKGFSFNDTELPDTAKQAWDFISTLYFSITSTTTIGYGHHSPMTDFGQLYCIGFSLLGIPLHMVTLGNAGKHLSNVINRLLNHVAGKHISKSQKKKDLGTFFVTGSLLIFFVIFSAGSVRLVFQEDISYIQAIYYIYVSISTIGFGDYVIRFETKSDFHRVMILAMWALALYIGMALLSATVMSISSQAKNSHRKMFDMVSGRIFGKKYKKPKRGRGGRGRDEQCPNDLIMVDVKFLVAQLDLQTDPDKRAEIQKWIDAYEENTSSDEDYHSDWSSNEPESEYSPLDEDPDHQTKCNGHDTNV